MKESQKELLYEIIKQRHPHLKERYETMFEEFWDLYNKNKVRGLTDYLYIDRRAEKRVLKEMFQ